MFEIGPLEQMKFAIEGERLFANSRIFATFGWRSFILPKTGHTVQYLEREYTDDTIDKSSL